MPRLKQARFILMLVSAVCLSACSDKSANEWQLSESNHSVRHEAGLVAHNNTMVLLGGRGERPIEVYDSEAQSWKQQLTPAQELHHFQAVSHDGLIYIIGALTGPWPEETAVSEVLTYNPDTQTLIASHKIPESRQRGAAGLVVYQDELYLLGGLTNGHMGGSVPWFDKYNPQTGHWQTLPDAPTARDHFQAVVVGHKLYAIAGRQTSHATGEGMSLTQAQLDVYDFNTHTWSTLPASSNLAVPRAGNMASALGKHIMVLGGESSAQTLAHNEVSIFDTSTLSWQNAEPMKEGRHGSGVAIIDSKIYTVSGSGKAGGEPELTTMEYLNLNDFDLANTANSAISFGQAFTLDIAGPEVSETDSVNPFTQYLMRVRFSHPSGQTKLIEGYFAGDGNAANTSAKAGNIWRSKFTPQRTGEWEYSAALYEGEDVVFASEESLTTMSPIAQANGTFTVGKVRPNDGFFAQNGQLSVKDGYFFFPHTQRYWIKAGANSPENFLAYHEVDGTYRAAQQARDGEAKAPDFIHEFTAHVQDWKAGDPTWQQNKGKGIIGAINYMADMGMQSQYFLTMNINGDGADVWPYTSHEEFERFDVSKLAQWDVIFSHLQARGVMLHVVTQETENELLLDGGNTERLRQLYYRELIARFGYHNGLVWNLGEENGPAEWSPKGQNDEQRIAMAAYFAQNDPHNNPIFLHTLPSAGDKDTILPPLYASAFDGISFQVDNRETVFSEIMKWRRASVNNGVSNNDGWAITMDEIGMWHTGAKVDADDPTHDSLRRHALWGALMAGATGVEWYFGAHQPHNDLSSEDFRQRENLWKQTKIAADFFNEQALSSLKPLTDGQGLYHMQSDTVDIIYFLPMSSAELPLAAGLYDVTWLDPISGARMHSAEVEHSGEGMMKINVPSDFAQKDTVLVLERKTPA